MALMAGCQRLCLLDLLAHKVGGPDVFDNIPSSTYNSATFLKYLP